MNSESAEGRFDPVDVDLKSRGWALFLAWLWPGAGHVYQGRYGKGVLFMACILTIYFWGLAMGDGHVVYASFRPSDKRIHFLLQAGVGLPALPAVVQAMAGEREAPLLGGWMTPPKGPVLEQQHDQKASWYDESGYLFEMGTLFTMVAGLLNVLAMYDAHSGPVFGAPESHSAREQEEASDSPKMGSGLQGIGMALGLVVALQLRTLSDSDSRWVTYLYAIAGLATGAILSRLVFGVTSLWSRRQQESTGSSS